MTRNTGFDPHTTALILERDRGCCSRCGKHVTQLERGRDWSIHHRAGRGIGGSKAEWVNAASAGVILCGSGTTGCHGVVESNRATAREAGWIVSRNGIARPTDIPIYHAIHGMVRLLDDGEVEKVDAVA